ncbi:MAG TPA: nicotinate phosphoribosyltransferase, partial [Gammaproteobacteria bacterium]|nr:nicotinate phosphoribosyltransferase [Gammaproteobacteria bacterium]
QGFGIGTALDASTDAPYLDCAYKLHEYAGRPRRKLSPGKATWPGAKQVYRIFDSRGGLDRDVVTLLDDPQPGQPLLEPIMRGGRLLAPLPDLNTARERTAANLATLPEPLRALDSHAEYRVEMAPALRALAEGLDSPS